MKPNLFQFYAFMTSLALIAGAGLGYWTGQGSAETEFANECISHGVFVIYDQELDQHRHFHCFELPQEQDSEQQTTTETPALLI